MKHAHSIATITSLLRVSSLVLAGALVCNLSSCKLPSDPKRSLQTVTIFGSTTGSLQNENDASGTKLPIAEAVAGRPGMVYSPHSNSRQLVNVSKFAPGDQVRCPYTNKLFSVPASASDLEIKGPAAIAYTEVAFPGFAIADDFRPLQVPLRPQPLKPTDPVAIIKRLGLDVFSQDVNNPSSNVGPLGLLPFAENVPGTPGMVYSPFAKHSKLVDVAGLMPGVEVTCPYTGKIFRVPAPPYVTAATR
jgi:hypothetical protein